MDTFNPKKRSWIMAQVKSSGNKSTEVMLCNLLKQKRITGWRRNYPVFGKPDFAFPKQKVAIFVDGCFWHGHPQKCRIPASNREYWEKKILRNIGRDRIVNSTLKKKGWKVVRIWEDRIGKPITASRIQRALLKDQGKNSR
jgi:DNA mismatch endonuclease, patch repair protein